MVLAFSLVALAAAEETTGSEWVGGLPLTQWTRLSGDWAGARNGLSERGLNISGLLVNEVSRVLRAGSSTGDRSAQRSQLNLGVDCDLEKAARISGAEISALYQYAGGDDAARLGDAQGWSNIAVASDIHQLSELWYQQRFGTIPGGGEGDLLRLKLGKSDAHSEFATAPALGQFLNSSAGFSPTIFPMTTYPDPAVGINLFVQPIAGLVAGFAYYDASAATRGLATGERGASSFFARGPDRDKLWLAQIAGQWDGGLAQAGVWQLRGDLAHHDGGVSTRTSGWYAVGQQDVWSDGAERTLSAVAQVAGADDALSDYAWHLAGGLWGQGLIPGREADGVGLYLSVVRFTDATDDQGERVFPATSEAALEAVYAFQATGWWLLRADAQYVRHPGGSVDERSAMVVALRSDISF